jgi:ketosteroid isomerase-like protein
MSGENVEAVRSPLTTTVHPRRRLEERLGLRFPRLLDFIARAIWRLPPWRLRRALVRRFVRAAWEAFNRRDLDACFMLYHADCESIFPRELATVGFPESGAHSREERIRAQQVVFDETEGLRFEPEELIEVGDRLVSVGHMRGTGPSSGAPIDTQWVAVLTTFDGRVIHEELFMDRREGLEAAGLSE